MLRARALDSATELHRETPHNPGFLSNHSPIVIFRSKNEALRLPAFLSHYRHIGAGGFIAIDNLSSDGSGDFLREQEDVLLYSATGSYRARSAGIDWINRLLWEHANHRWIVLADVDELLVYPGIENDGIGGLIHAAQRAGDSSVYTPMLDMYSSQPLSSLDYQTGDPFLGLCDHFDSPASYSLNVGHKGYHLFGGVRKRVFFKDSDHEPALRKVAMLYWTRQTGFVTPHVVCPTRLNKPRTVAVMLHFKMLQDFHTKVHAALEEKSHWNDSAEYSSYKRELEHHVMLNLTCPESTHYQSSGSIACFTSWIERKISEAGS